MSSSDSASASHIARLVERAEATAGAARASWTLQTEIARVREAHTRWRDAATKPEFGAWTFGLGNRALSGALTAHLESLERGADASAVASTLLEVCFAVAGFEGHVLAASAPPTAERAPAPLRAGVPSFMQLAAAPAIEAATRTAAVEPPPRVGPLATVQGAPIEPSPTAEGHESSVHPQAESAPSVSPEGERFTLEDCAAIAASLARKKREKDVIWQEREMTESDWARLEARTADALRAESALGRRELLSRYDDAYVRQLELERGAIDVRQFVELSLAQERGTITEVLDKLDLPRGAMPRVSRVWLRKMSADRQLARQVREAMRDAGA